MQYPSHTSTFDTRFSILNTRFGFILPSVLFPSPYPSPRRGEGIFIFLLFEIRDTRYDSRARGAHDRTRTGDLILTKDVLYLLSYMGNLSPVYRISYMVCRDPFASILFPKGRRNSFLRGASDEPSYYSHVSSFFTIYDIRYTIYETGGEGWIRTNVGNANGFTARPIWPLWHLPMSLLYYKTLMKSNTK